MRMLHYYCLVRKTMDGFQVRSEDLVVRLLKVPELGYLSELKVQKYLNFLLLME